MFIIWGALHGTAIVLHRAWKSLGFTMNKLLAWFITFNFINITWIFFRAENWQQAKNILVGIAGLNNAHTVNSFVNLVKMSSEISFLDVINIQDSISTSPIACIFTIILFFHILLNNNSIELIKIFKNYKITYAVISAIFFVVAIYNLDNASEFLYFNF